MRKILFFLIFLINFYACKKNNTDTKHRNTLKYANLFSIEVNKTDTLIKIYNVNGDSLIITVSKTNKSDIKIPVSRVVCLSTTHIGYIEALGEEDKIIGVAGAKYIYNKKLIKKYNNKKLADVGFGPDLNIETVIKLKPHIVFVYYFNDENKEKFDILKQLGIKVIPINEYQEKTPLGRSEWIKLFGILFQKQDTADSIFAQIETNYNYIKNLEKKIDSPIVLVNIPFNGNWYFPGKKSFLYQLISDAGGKLIFTEKQRVITIPFEQILKLKDTFDFLLNPANAQNINQIINTDQRLKFLKCIKNQQVYNNNKRLGKYGGNDFFESGVLRSDIIIRDLYNIFNLETQNLFYYKKLDLN